MPYKDPKIHRKKALERYYKNKEKIIKYQVDRLKRKYKEDMEHRNKVDIRSKSKRRNRLDNMKCCHCGLDKDLQRHHPTYDSPYHIILCRSCHIKLHNDLKEIHTYVKAISATT